ncbi:MAG: glycosyltransferase [Candidatus Levyibacteriota bacterium]
MINATEIAIVTPSYNEVENIHILINKISSVLMGSKIIIVDDSNAQVNKEINKIIKKNKKVILISRFKKLGRGSAMIRGFKEALKDNRIKYIFEMDSDLAHNPVEFKRFFRKAKNNNFDLIIGSRYLPGGKIVNIAKNRTILSRIINKFLRLWLGINVSDFTSGFRFYSRKAVRKLITSDIEAKGFIALSETLYVVSLSGYNIGEVPITWNYRIHGKSNVNFKELIVSLYFVVKMRITKR